MAFAGEGSVVAMMLLDAVLFCVITEVQIIPKSFVCVYFLFSFIMCVMTECLFHDFIKKDLMDVLFMARL